MEKRGIIENLDTLERLKLTLRTSLNHYQRLKSAVGNHFIIPSFSTFGAVQSIIK